MKQQVRIIGGKYRGKKISFPNTEGLRPTSDRIRETLFNWLMHHIIGARCLDAFAGSGALGFEAFSRGANEVVLIEQSALVYKNLQRIAHDFTTPAHENKRLEVIHSDAEHYLKTNPNPFDIIFLDPPFALNNHNILLDLIHISRNLKKDGLIYIESPHLLTLNETQWKIVKSKQAGAVYYALLSSVS